MTYELDPYSLEIYQMCEYELPTSRFRNVSYDRHTDRQTDKT